MTRRLVEFYPNRHEHTRRRIGGIKKMRPGYSETLCPRCARNVWQHAEGCPSAKEK